MALDEKSVENLNPDRSKHFVGCYQCIQNGFVRTRGLQLVHRRDHLPEHYSKCHPGHVIQEWQFIASVPNKKQQTMLALNTNVSQVTQEQEQELTIESECE